MRMADADMKMLRKNIRHNRDIRLLHQSLLAHADYCVDDTMQITYTFDASGRRRLHRQRLPSSIVKFNFLKVNTCSPTS